MLTAIAALLLLGIIVQTRWRGRSIAARVAALTRRPDRALTLYGWAAGTALTFLVPAMLALAMVGRADAIRTLPPELAAWRLARGLEPASGHDAAVLVGSIVLGAALGVALLLIRRRWRTGPVPVLYRSPAAARTSREWSGAGAIALSAGIGEELFFRLAMPLVIGLASGEMSAGLVVSTLAFALVHWHQGWKGMVATGLVGAGLMYLYLVTGALWVPMALHVAIDCNALILRPWLDRPVPAA